MDNRVRGRFDLAFSPVIEQLQANIAEWGETGAALAIETEGRLVVDVRIGDYPDGAVQVVRSISKGILAVLALIGVDRGLMALDRPIANFWPEFAAGGKEKLPMRSVLEHTAGLPYVEKSLQPTDLFRWRPAVEAVAEQSPIWKFGTKHGYHDLTFGLIIGELIQRTSGRGLGLVLKDEIANRFGGDIWLGVPSAELSRVVSLRRSRQGTDQTHDLDRSDDSPLSRSVNNPDLRRWEHRPEYLRSSVPSSNIVASASAVARVFGSLAATDNPLISARSLAEARTPAAGGPDEVVGWHRSYSTGFMLPDPTRPMFGPSVDSFGYYGRGGSAAFVAPDFPIALAYLTRQDQFHLGADPRTELVAQAVRQSIGL